MPERVVALIPARGGSRGIPRKNIVDVGGKPLIAWCITSAVASKVFAEVWVSTDDIEIANIAREWGASIHMRDPSTATCEASTESALLDFLRSVTGVDVLCLIQATSPLTLPQHFVEAFDAFKSGGADSLVTVTRRHIFLWSNDGTPLNYQPETRPRRQDWDGVLVENGAFYFTLARAFMISNSRLSGKRIVYEMPPKRSVEIDDDTDLITVRALVEQSRSDDACSPNT